MIDPILLMQLRDGELDADAEAALLEQLEHDEDAMAQLEGLSQLGEFVRAYADHESDGFASVADSVQQQLAASAEPSLDAPSQNTPSVSAPSNVRPLVATKPASDVEQPPRTWILGVGTALAAAAAVLLWLELSAESPRGATAPPAEQPSVVVAPAPVPPAALPTPVVDEDPVAIVAVDFGGSDGTIFVVGDESTPVVWLDDPPPAQGAKVGPL